MYVHSVLVSTTAAQPYEESVKYKKERRACYCILLRPTFNRKYIYTISDKILDLLFTISIESLKRANLTQLFLIFAYFTNYLKKPMSQKNNKKTGFQKRTF